MRWVLRSKLPQWPRHVRTGLHWLVEIDGDLVDAVGMWVGNGCWSCPNTSSPAGTHHRWPARFGRHFDPSGPPHLIKTGEQVIVAGVRAERRAAYAHGKRSLDDENHLVRYLDSGQNDRG